MNVLVTLLAGALAMGAQQQTDTTFAVAAGGRLQVEGLNGSVVVRSWERDAMRVRATHPPGARVAIRQRGGTVSLEASQARGPAPSVSYEVLVPRSFSVQVGGVNMRTTVDGVHGRIEVANAEGEITVRGVTGDVAVESVNGAITVEDVRGRVEATTVNQTVRLTGVHGDLEASTVNGGIIMRGIDAHNVEASTLNGIVEYSGTVHDRGRYYLGAHNGQVIMSLPGTANAAVHISTRMGQVDADFAVPVSNLRDGRLSFTLGSGSARVELESFSGAVRLVRPRTNP